MKITVLCLLFCYSLYQITPDKTTYIKTDPLKESIVRGREIYNDFCVSCHLPNGKGVEKVYPPLAKSDFLLKETIESIKAIKFGKTGRMVVNGKIYNGSMMPLGLSDDEVADVMNYITNAWGNKNDKIITEDDVAKIKK
ncbi:MULTISPECIES: cytochrome c [unclassified Algibacter]|uniref:c-type cytochrome n=1 Tax=unclassified Algibacter TaxID=2615009 RepID=UPI0018EEF956|nr:MULTISPECIES: cytochrome c [unclassified Algibacter]MCL5129902.1 cytochrome c [Algibacter sp. L4_22]